MEWLAAAMALLAFAALLGFLYLQRQLSGHLAVLQALADHPVATPGHVTGVAQMAVQAIEISHASLKDALAAEVQKMGASIPLEGELRAALRGYEQSHQQRHEMTVNGFTKVETILCECGLCQAARTALR